MVSRHVAVGGCQGPPRRLHSPSHFSPGYHDDPRRWTRCSLGTTGPSADRRFRQAVMPNGQDGTGMISVTGGLRKAASSPLPPSHEPH